MSVRVLYDAKVIDTKALADATGIGVIPREVGTRASESAFYVVAGPGVSAGVVLVEEAPFDNYGGTWATVATLTINAASKVFRAAVNGNFGSLRMRISTGITGGTIDAYATIAG